MPDYSDLDEATAAEWEREIELDLDTCDLPADPDESEFDSEPW